MKLLLDENLSHRLVDVLQAQYPATSHVRLEDFGGAPDCEIWSYAKKNGFVIASKDDDFRQRSFVEGPPPKVVWLQVGNAGTDVIADLLARELKRLLAFELEDESSLLILRASV